MPPPGTTLRFHPARDRLIAEAHARPSTPIAAPALASRIVQRLTWQAYMNKELVRADPGAHMRIFMKDMGHLLGLSRAVR